MLVSLLLFVCHFLLVLSWLFRGGGGSVSAAVVVAACVNVDDAFDVVVLLACLVFRGTSFGCWFVAGNDGQVMFVGTWETFQTS